MDGAKGLVRPPHAIGGVRSLAGLPTRNVMGSPAKGKGHADYVFNLTDGIHASEVSFLEDGTSPTHRLEVSVR